MRSKVISVFVFLLCLQSLILPSLAQNGRNGLALRNVGLKTDSVSAGAVPAPKDVIGFTPGDDRKLASWSQVVDYFKKLERASDRIKFQELGKTTVGRPFVLAT